MYVHSFIERLRHFFAETRNRLKVVKRFVHSFPSILPRQIDKSSLDFESIVKIVRKKMRNCTCFYTDYTIIQKLR